MSDRSIRTAATSSIRRTGLLVAAAFALIAAGVIMFVMISSGPANTGTATPGTVVDIGKTPDGVGRSADPNQIEASEAARMQFVDKSDPNRLGSELSFDKLDPVGPGYYKLTQPRAWVYTRDGRVLHIRADNGRVKMPNPRQQPESGEFHGNVVVRLFSPPAPTAEAPAKPIDAEKDTPSLVCTTDSFTFDSVLLELHAPDHVILSAENLLFEGDDLLIGINQVKERIEKLRTKGQFVRYNPKIKHAKPSAAHAAPAPSPPAKAAGADPSNIPAAPADPKTPAPKTVADTRTFARPKEQLYRATFSDEVNVTQTTRTLEADTLRVFARLIDNQLPENALGTWEEGPHAAKPEPAKDLAAPTPPTETTHAPAGATPTPVAKATPNLFITAHDEDVVLSWTGLLVLAPVVDGPLPVELANGNHFAARFSADKVGGRKMVTLKDSATDARGECAQIDYAATSRTLSLLSGPDAKDVRFEAPQSGLLIIPRADVDLGTGLATVVGPGKLLAMKTGKAAPPTAQAAAPTERTAPLPPDQTRQITWTDQADFRFRTAAGCITDVLEWSQFKGTVLARDKTSAVSGDVLTADFMTVGKQASAIKHLKVEGNALAIGGSSVVDPNRPPPLPSIDPYIACDKFDVGFEPSKLSPDDVDPVLAIAVGNVKAANRESTLRARRLEASMVRDEKNPGTILITDVLGQDNVVYERIDGVSAKSDELRASPTRHTARLTGQLVAIARGASTIFGKQIDLDDAAGTMIVFQEGTFEHTQPESPASTAPSPPIADASGVAPSVGAPPPPPAPNPTHIVASWHKGMIFNNTTGTIQCSGETVVTSTSNLQTQTLRSERLNLWLTPASQNDPQITTTAASPAPTGAAGTGTIAVGDNRRLLRAEAIGASEDREGAPHATIETRRYAPPPEPGADRVLEQVFYVEGPRILADDEAGTVLMPTAGRAVMRDQRVATAARNTQAVTSALPLTGGGGGSRGDSRFTWGESMLFTRSTGVLTMKKDVKLEHKPLGSSDVTRLLAAQMDATFNTDKTAVGKDRSAELVRAEASGSVYAESGQQHLVSDTFAYNALAGTAEAAASGGNKVSFSDDKKGTQIVAKKLFWDLVKDRVEIMEPAPMTSPR